MGSWGKRLVKAASSILVAGGILCYATTPKALVLPEHPEQPVAVQASAGACWQEFMSPLLQNTAPTLSEGEVFRVIDRHQPYDVVAEYSAPTVIVPLYSHGNALPADGSLPLPTQDMPTVLAPLPPTTVVSINGEAVEDSVPSPVHVGFYVPEQAEGLPADYLERVAQANGLVEVQHEGPLYESIHMWVQSSDGIDKAELASLDEYVVVVNARERMLPLIVDAHYDPIDAIITRVTGLTSPLDLVFEPGQYDLFMGVSRGDGRLYQRGNCSYSLQTTPVVTAVMRNGGTMTDISVRKEATALRVPEQFTLALRQGERLARVDPALWEHYMGLRRYDSYIAGITGTPLGITRIGVVVFDPVDSQGRRMSELYPSNDPELLLNSFIADITDASHGNAQYEVAARLTYPEFPLATNGSRFTAESYRRCITERQPECTAGSSKLLTADYRRLYEELGLCDLAWKENLSEIWFIGPSWFGFGEHVITGPALTSFNGGDHNAPSCGRTLVMMGFNTERNLPEMLEAYSHRIEGMMKEKYNGWRAGSGRTVWDDFTTADKDVLGNAQCGYVHFPPNGRSDYDWGSREEVLSNCDAWDYYPELPEGMEHSIDCDEWGCTGKGFLEWWLSHIPHNDSQGSATNWWRYILRPDSPN